MDHTYSMELDKKINIVLNTIFFIFEKYTLETWPILDTKTLYSGWKN